MRREAPHVLLARVIPALPTEPADRKGGGEEATRRCDFGASPSRDPYLISLVPVIVRASTGATCSETRFLRTAPEYITAALQSHFFFLRRDFGIASSLVKRMPRFVEWIWSISRDRYRSIKIHNQVASWGKKSHAVELIKQLLKIPLWLSYLTLLGVVMQYHAYIL